MDPKTNTMLKLATFQLTHPETLSEIELREILEDSCIDSSTYKNLSRPKLIDLYKRVAMPLPQRKSQDDQNSSHTKNCDEEQSSAKELHKNSTSLNGARDVRKDKNETEASQYSGTSRLKSPINEFKHTNKKIRLNNSNNVRQWNGSNKRMNNEMHNDSSSKKRQKITWP